ncbi:MAG: bifunctional methylenetetrahydrofolate dehydrogenase/methenyltetrahydrofolate cyclohydrolase FolD [Nitrospirota bacterium]|nr:bifunctional methylenetetrahydrofolate dehydrogenase/methenyltetrahydrofolate cyclohydrolase FolD [Nitrospirota bacterium]
MSTRSVTSHRILDGKAVAARLRAELAGEVAAMRQRGTHPTVAVLLVGDDPASQVYVRNKQRACGEVGIGFRLQRLPTAATETDVLAHIRELNADRTVHGILVQLPLPRGIREAACIQAVAPEKDVDGFHPLNVGLAAQGEDAFQPCTPLGVMRLLAETGIPVAGRHAVVVGRGAVGRPLADLLVRAHATVTICHSKTRDLPTLTRQADLLFACAGVPRLIRADMVQPGAVVVDVGIHRLTDGSLCGDVDFEALRGVAGCITPVPGGVGPMTVAMLLANTVRAALRAG